MGWLCKLVGENKEVGIDYLYEFDDYLEEVEGIEDGYAKQHKGNEVLINVNKGQKEMKWVCKRVLDLV